MMWFWWILDKQLNTHALKWYGKKHNEMLKYYKITTHLKSNKLKSHHHAWQPNLEISCILLIKNYHCVTLGV